jgi:hypothetical protein
MVEPFAKPIDFAKLYLMGIAELIIGAAEGRTRWFSWATPAFRLN